MPLDPWMNTWIMKNREGEGSSVGGNSERHLGKRSQRDLCADEISQVRGPKKTKMESPPAPKAYLFQPGEKWTSVDNFPVEVFDGFKLGKDAQFDDGLTRGVITSQCFNRMDHLKQYIIVTQKLLHHYHLVLSKFFLVSFHVLSDLVDGFGSCGDKLRTALDQSEKEKAVLRDKLSLVYNMYQTRNVMRLQLEHSEKEKADLRDKLELVFKLYD
ncbi:hypothetical protein AgCh_027568 [Apium graveolens]